MGEEEDDSMTKVDLRVGEECGIGEKESAGFGDMKSVGEGGGTRLRRRSSGFGTDEAGTEGAPVFVRRGVATVGSNVWTCLS